MDAFVFKQVHLQPAVNECNLFLATTPCGLRGCNFVRIDPLRFLARCHTRRLNELSLSSPLLFSLSVSLSLSLRFNGHLPGEPGLAGVY